MVSLLLQIEVGVDQVDVEVEVEQVLDKPVVLDVLEVEVQEVHQVVEMEIEHEELSV
jgi:hypothetical protein